MDAVDLYGRTSVNRQRMESFAVQRAALSAKSAALHLRSWELRMRSKALRDGAAAARLERRRPAAVHAGDSRVNWFSVEGVLGDEHVWARWEHGHLECHPSLETQARLIVDLGTVFRRRDPAAWVEATITGPPAAVMFTLAQACDRVTSVKFEPAHGA